MGFFQFNKFHNAVFIPFSMALVPFSRMVEKAFHIFRVIIATCTHIVILFLTEDHYLNNIDKKRIESAFYQPKSNPDTRVGMY